MHDEFDDDPEINLTPMIDVIFMLLIFFVMSMTFSKPVLDVVLPSSSQSHALKKGSELQITVREDGSVWVDDKKIERSALEGVLAANADKRFNLFIDKKAPFQAFVSVVDIAKKQNGARFVISTQNESTPQ